jgi:hypothetical protein
VKAAKVVGDYSPPLFSTLRKKLNAGIPTSARNALRITTKETERVAPSTIRKPRKTVRNTRTIITKTIVRN